MNPSDVIELLEANKNEKGILNWEKGGRKKRQLKSYGIGLTRLRKLAKTIGRDHELSQKLWTSDIYDARIIAMLIDEPKKMTKAEAEEQVELLTEGHLEHVFSSCDASLGKTSFVQELTHEWIHHKDIVRRSCGYGLLYELSKSKKKSVPSEAYFLERVEQIQNTFDNEHKRVQDSMIGALLGIGKRTVNLNTAALLFAKRIGPFEITSDGQSCEPFNLEKHLTSDYLKEKLEL